MMISFQGSHYREAGELKKHFNDAFGMEKAGFFALGFDAQKHHIRSIRLNPGHCLATGIADTSRALATADRLMADDLFSGWGIRLSQPSTLKPAGRRPGRPRPSSVSYRQCSASTPMPR
jgi:glycogen debranching enzyme